LQTYAQNHTGFLPGAAGADIPNFMEAGASGANVLATLAFYTGSAQFKGFRSGSSE